MKRSLSNQPAQAITDFTISRIHFIANIIQQLYETIGSKDLDEYLRKLLEEQQARYLASKAYMADQSKIDENEWERLFREQVAGYFEVGGEIDQGQVEEKMREMENSLDSLSTSLGVIEVKTNDDLMELHLNDVFLDIARQLMLDDMKKQLNTETDDEKRDRLLRNLQESSQQFQDAQRQRRQAQQRALAERLALRSKLKKSGLDEAAIDNALEEYDAVLQRQTLSIVEESVDIEGIGVFKLNTGDVP